MHSFSVAAWVSTLLVVFGEVFRDYDFSEVCLRCRHTNFGKPQRFCPKCGGQMWNHGTDHYCLRCRASVGDNQFCPSCGQRAVIGPHNDVLYPCRPNRDKPVGLFCLNGHEAKPGETQRYCGKCGGQFYNRTLPHTECADCGHIEGYNLGPFCSNCGSKRVIARH